MNEAEYYLILDDKEQGPFTIGQVRSLWNVARITTGTLYWQPGMDGWRPLSEILSMLELHDEAKPAVKLVKSAKSRGVYIILGIFFGVLGIHNFYAGYIRKGMAQIIVCDLSVGLVMRARTRPNNFGIVDPGDGNYFGQAAVLGAFALVGVVISVIVDLRTNKTDASGDPLV